MLWILKLTLYEYRLKYYVVFLNTQFSNNYDVQVNLNNKGPPRPVVDAVRSWLMLLTLSSTPSSVSLFLEFARCRWEMLGEQRSREDDEDLRWVWSLFGGDPRSLVSFIEDLSCLPSRDVFQLACSLSSCVLSQASKGRTPLHFHVLEEGAHSSPLPCVRAFPCTFLELLQGHTFASNKDILLTSACNCS